MFTLPVADNDVVLPTLLVAGNYVDIEVDILLHDVGAWGPTSVGCPFVDDEPPAEDTVADGDHLPTRVAHVDGDHLPTRVAHVDVVHALELGRGP